MNADTSLPGLISKNAPARYAVAILATAVALLACRALDSSLPDHVPYVMLFPAVAFSAWYCGVGPLILAVLFALLGAKYWFIPPIHSLRISSAREFIAILVFLFAAGVVAAMGEAGRRENKKLQKAQGDLEGRVKERTAELDAANHNLRELTARLLQLQDDERRRFARELHDSVGQTLVGLTMNLSAVRAGIERLTKTAKALTDSETLVQNMSKEIRTISYLMHPPMLDEAGLSSAIGWYIDGFSQRGNIQVVLEMADDFGRLPQELETTIFRTVQECLTNIHRHSGSPSARIHISRSATDVIVQVEDKGMGIPLEKRNDVASGGTPGVGLRGMRERLRQLGGSLEIRSDGKGTLVSARLPLAGASSVAA